jgi:TolB-like protein
LPLGPGSTLGPYTILGPLGAGGMGRVFRASDARLGREVAIKALPPAVAREPERLQRFEREARALAALQHAHVAVVHGIEESDEGPCLVMELVAGETLAERLLRGPLPLEETLRLGEQVAGALEVAHAKGIVHRDLKPANLMRTPDGDAKVLDFGLAKDAEGARGVDADLSVSPTVAAGSTALGTILGTAPYMSPEQARAQAVDGRTDIWSLGCVLFECLTGRGLFVAATVSDVLARILEREPDWNALPSSTPVSLRLLLQRMLAKEVMLRAGSMGEVRRSLQAVALEGSKGARVGSAIAEPELPSVAVLDFENTSGDAESDYFCEGIADDLLTDLTRLKGLRVASRAAVTRLRGRELEPGQLARELGVRHLLQGSVRRAGERLRINVRLVDGQDGFQRWAERYDRTLADVFAVQEEIAAAVAEALRVALAPAEVAQLVQDRPADVTAYDLYLRGRARYRLYTHEAMLEAHALFEQATRVDAGYALAWAGLADASGQLSQQGGAGEEESRARDGLEAARRALTLNPRLPEAHKAEALNLRLLGDREGAIAALRRALEVDPDFAPALVNSGVYHFGRGRLPEAERLFRRAATRGEAQPFAMLWIALLCLSTRRDDEAVSFARRAAALAPEPVYQTGAAGTAVLTHLRRGETDAASRAIAEGRKHGIPEFAAAGLEAAVLVARGERAAVLAQLEVLVDSPATDAWTLIAIAASALRVQRLDIARTILGRRVFTDIRDGLVRYLPELRLLLGADGMPPRRESGALVWPLEAPMLDAELFAQYDEVRIESGLAEPAPPPGQAGTASTA